MFGPVIWIARAGAIAALAGPSLNAQAQPRSAPPVLEVASVKLHPGARTFSDLSTSGTRITASALTLNELIANAFNLREDQVVGPPPWARADLYDITAKAEGTGELDADQTRLLLQAILKDRFALKWHRETRDLPVYALIVGKNGPKLSDADVSGNNPGMRMTRTGTINHIVSWHSTMAQLAQLISTKAGRPVVDNTALTEKYAYHLDWNLTDAADADIPSLLTAVQEQLGLRLDPQKAPFEVLVVDSLERPSEN